MTLPTSSSSPSSAPPSSMSASSGRAAGFALSLPEHWSVSGTLFDGLTSRAYPARLWLEGDVVMVQTLEAAPRQWQLPLTQLRIEPPLVGLPRVLALHSGRVGARVRALGLTPAALGSGARLETGEAEQREAVTLLEKALRRNRVARLASALEQRWGGVLLSLLLLLGFGYGFIVSGLPLAARQAALLTSPAALQKLDGETVHYLQNSEVLQPSRLSVQRQQHLTRGFEALARERGGSYHYHLLFRRGGPMKANAFALPAGTVVITDELIGLAQSDRQIYGVLAHEISHVTHRDALTQIYQALGLSLLVGAITGDLVGPTTAAAAVPTFLLQNRYSRQMESVADYAAGEYLLAHGGTTNPLQEMLARLEAVDGEGSSAVTKTKKPRKTGQESPSQPERHPWLENWLGNHPVTAKRIADLQAQERAWKSQRSSGQR